MDEPLAVVSIIGGVVVFPALALLMLKRRARPYAATVLGLSSLLGALGCVGVPGYCTAMFLMFFFVGALVFGAVATVIAIVIKVIGRNAA